MQHVHGPMLKNQVLRVIHLNLFRCILHLRPPIALCSNFFPEAVVNTSKKIPTLFERECRFKPSTTTAPRGPPSLASVVPPRLSYCRHWAAYGTAKSGIGIAGIGAFRPELMMKALIPVVMADLTLFSGIIAVYGLVVAVLVANDISPSKKYSLYASALHMGAGLSTGLAGVAAGYAIGIVGDACVRGYLYQPRLFVGMVLILIFGGSVGVVWIDCELDLEHEGF
ncbi:hypothetical protein BC829DRAFT_213079 [Chytridium lagenaria]|nr:hypothetical protein BC829DRAFT_213079 [Chytridium lagenaria]